MSFSFYNRLSSRSNRTKDSKDMGYKHASASLATATFILNQSSVPQTSSPNHSRNSSRMRLIPFLGKRRKSLATLRPNAIAEDEVVTKDNYGSGRCFHRKSVTQLANETAQRLARSPLRAAGSRSTGNLELPTFESSPLKLCVDSACTTSVRNRPLDARHTMFPSGSTKNSTPDKVLQAENKRNSERPEKASFLSRISSRPSLSARYSSADLKSASKMRGFFRSGDKRQEPLVAPQRKDIVHPLYIAPVPSLVEDTDFFTSPRAAPTPPNLRFASPNSSLLDSPAGPSHSAASLPSQKPGPHFSTKDSTRSLGINSVRHLYAAQTLAKHDSSPTATTSPVSLSPETALRTPRRHSVSTHGKTSSPVSAKSMITSNTTTGSPAARPRTSHVRIGTESVTVSVANVLETELGVEVGDSDSSYYDDSYEETQRFGNQWSRPHQNDSHGKSFKSGPSDLPPLSPSADDLNLAFKFPKKTDSDFSLEAQSPLSALMSASIRGKDHPASSTSAKQPSSTDGQTTKNGETRNVSDALDVASSKRSLPPRTQGQALQNARAAYLHSLAPQSRDVDRLDRISERSVSVRQESPRDVEDKNKKTLEVPSTNSSPALTSELQRALDVQCARFDKLAGHLLQIIQRHQNEKVQLESQITTLQKEARRNEQEIKALRKLVLHSSESTSQDGWNSRRLVRVASMQSFISNISGNDEEEVDMSVAVEMLARAGRRSVLLTPDLSKDLRASVDLSPRVALNKVEKPMDLRRSKTMPDLHKVSTTNLSPMSTPSLQGNSPDASGLGLRFEFPLPEPLKLPSIATTIISCAKNSNASVPALTDAPTASSGLSLATESSSNSMSTVTNRSLEAKPYGLGRGSGRSTREKRMAGEWHAGRVSGLYRPADKFQQPPTAPPSCKIPALPASSSYANNLNKTFIASPIEQVMQVESPDLDAIYKKLVSNSNGLLG